MLGCKHCALRASFPKKTWKTQVPVATADVTHRPGAMTMDAGGAYGFVLLVGAELSSWWRHSQDYDESRWNDYFRLFPYVTSLYIYIYIHEIYVYIYIDVCSILFLHVLLFTTCLRKLMAPKMSLRSSDFRTSSAHSTKPCRLVGDRWLGAGGRTALGVAQCGTFALRYCWNRMCVL